MAEETGKKARGAWAAVLPPLSSGSQLIELNKLIGTMTSSPGWPAFVALIEQRAGRIGAELEPAGAGDPLPSYEAHIRAHALMAALKQTVALPAVIAEKAAEAEQALERRAQESGKGR